MSSSSSSSGNCRLYNEGWTTECRSHYSFSSGIALPKHVDSFVYEVDPDNCVLKYKKSHILGELDLNLNLSEFLCSKDLCVELYDRRKFTHLHAAGLRICEGFVEFFCLNFHSSLLYVDLSYAKNTQHNDMLYINNLINLVDLDISGIPCVTDMLVTDLRPTIERISGLYVNKCELLTDNSLFFIGDVAHRANFRRFSASHNPNFTFRGVNKFLYMSEQLELFNVESCSSLKFLGLVIRNKDMLGEIMKQYASRKLSSLNISNLQLVPESMDWIASASGCLKTLEANNLNGLTDGHLQGLIHISSNKLEKLSFYGNRNMILSDQALVTIASCCSSTLVDLNMSNVSTFDPSDKRGAKFAKKLSKIFFSCRSLRFADISNITAVNDSVFVNIRSICENLVKLNVAYCSLTNVGITKIADFFPNLKYLNINDVVEATDAGVALVARRCVNLRTFLCRNCVLLTDLTILEIFQYCSMIQTLVLSSDRRYIDAWGARFAQFTDAIIIAAMKSRTLKALEVSNQYGICFKDNYFKTGNEFGKIGNHSIEKLDLRGLDNIVISKLSFILQNCFSLNHVILPFNKEEFKSAIVDRDFLLRSFQRKLYGSSDELLSLLLELPSTGKSIKRHGTAGISKKGDEKDTKKQLASLLSPNKKEKTPLSLLVEKRTTQTGLMKLVYSSSMKSSDCVYPLDVSYLSVEKEESDDDITVSSVLSVDSKSSSALALEAEIEALKAETDSLIKEKSVGFIVLTPHIFSRHFRQRDQFISRRILENWAINKIKLKYKKFKLWQKFAYRVSARRIANTYKIILERRKLLIRIKEFNMKRSAKLIQRRFRAGVMRFARRAMRIQRFWRGILFVKRCSTLKLRKACATLIQKIFRGTRVRLSDGYILRQVFMKLPPFWKSFMTSTTNHDGTTMNTRQMMDSMGKPMAKDKANRKKLFLYQVQDLTKDAQRMQHHILNEICKDGTLAPKIPLIVPQSFDKAPFVSLNDGRVITFYSTKNTILATNDDDFDEKTGERKSDGITGITKGKPLHIFNIQLWPHTSPIEFEDTSTLLYDNHKNNFDVVQNYRDIIYCDLCNNRLRSVNCHTCRRGLCFYCAFRIHIKPGKRMHSVTVAEPRVVHVKEVENSLIYHIDAAMQVNHEIQYLVKYLRSAAEVMRINNEKKLMKEFEAEQDRKRQEYLIASAEVKDKHDAATIIECIMRKMIAKRIVQERRIQMEVEFFMKQKNKHKDATNVILIQRIFREFSTRLWLSKYDIKFKKLKMGSGNKFKKKKTPKVPYSERISKDEIERRINWEIQQRRIIERKNLIYLFFDKYIETLQTIEANIKYWMNYCTKVPDLIEKLQVKRDIFHLEHQKHVAEVALKKVDISQLEYEQLERVSRSLSIRVEFMDARIGNEHNALWWIKEILRNNCRRRSALKERIVDILHRNIWIQVESNILSRIENIINDRKRRLMPRQRVKLLIAWLTKNSQYCAMHQSTLDVSQQSLLTEEIEKLMRDLNSSIEADNLLQELVTALKQDNLYYSERISLDKISILAGTDKNNSVDQNDVVGKLVLIKTKQMQLQENVIDTVKVGLQQKMNAETDYNQKFYGFSNDNPDTPVEKLHLIKCILIDKFGASSDYINCYLLGPNWKKEKAEREAKEAKDQESIIASSSAAMKAFGAGLAAVSNLFGTLFGRKDKEGVEEVKEEVKDEGDKKKKKKKNKEKEKGKELLVIEKNAKNDTLAASALVPALVASDVPPTLVSEVVVEEPPKFLSRKERMEKAARDEEERINFARKEDQELRKALAEDLREHGPKHLSIKEFYSIYYIQPWLAEQAVADVRAEEQLAVMEIELEKVLFEYAAITFQIKDTNKKIEVAKKALKELAEEINIRQDPYFRQREEDMNRTVFEEVTEDEEAERMEMLQAMEGEVLRKNTELDLSEQLIMQLTESEKPKIIRRDEIISNISIQRQQIEKRVEDRAHMGTVFYNYEEEICCTQPDDDEQKEEKSEDGNENPDEPKRVKTPKLKDTVANEIALIIDQVEKEGMLYSKYSIQCELYQFNRKLLQDVVDDNLDLYVRNALDVVKGSWDFRVNGILYKVKPRQYVPAIDLAKIQVELRSLVLMVAEFGVKEFKQHLEEEENIVDDYIKNQDNLIAAFDEYKKYLLLMRRQKSLQTELTLRKEKLKQVRELAILTLKEKKAAALKAAEDSKKEVQAKKDNRSKMIAQIGQNIKKGIRATKDFFRDFSANMDARMDAEEVKILKNIKAKNKEGASSKPEGIRKLLFTKGEEEMNEFTIRNDLLRERGLPFYIRMERGLGDSIYLWYQGTFDSSLFITLMEIGHKDPGHPLYKDPEVFEKAGMEAVKHDSTSLVIWLKRDAQKSRGVGALAITFTEVEENRAIQDGFEKIDVDLIAFNLPDTFLWQKRINKISAAVSENTDSIINEIIKIRGTLKRQPYDKALQNLHEKLRDKLSNAHKKEAGFVVTNPLQSAVELLALSADELEAFLKIYESMDKNQSGKVTLPEIYEFLDDTIRNEFFDSLFVIVDALELEYGAEEEVCEFGDFMRTICTFAFFGKEEILRMLFVFTDKDKKGFITHAQYVYLLNVLHPFDKSRPKRALKDMQLKPDAEMQLSEFKKLNDQFPGLCYPAFKFQQAIRDKFLGYDWWFKKLEKYKNVRRKITESGANQERIVEIELERFNEDLAREKRMKEREHAIKKEADGPRKILLQAQQFLDEVS